MSIRCFQTHSGVILHVLRPTEKDAGILQSEYGLHPLDTAAFLEVQEEAEASRYHDDNRLQLCLPWMVDGRAVSCDISLVWNSHQVIIVHDTPDRMIAGMISTDHQLVDRSPLDIVTAILLDLTKHLESFDVARVPETQNILQRNWQAIERLLSILPEPLPPDYFAAWRLAVHRVKHLERLTQQPVAVSPTMYADRAPRTAMRFAAASVLIFVSVLWALH